MKHEEHLKHVGKFHVFTNEEIKSRLVLEDILDTETNECAWRKEVQFVEDYLPPFSGENHRPMKVVIYYPKFDSFLRYSRGPKQGYFWDVYGDDFMTVGLALLALRETNKPVGKPYLEFVLPINKKVT